jgi:hypothetical protein
MNEKENFDIEKEMENLGITTKSAETTPAASTSSAPAPNSDKLNELTPEQIGRVAISDELYISTTESKIEVYIPQEKRQEIDVGQYVVIPIEYRDEKLFGYIKKLSYQKRDALDDMSEVHVLISADDVGEEEYIELAQIDPLSMITSAAKPIEVRTIPKPNTVVRHVATKEEVMIGLDLPEDGLFMGYVSVNGEQIELQGGLKVPYYLNNSAEKTGDPMIFTHVLIAGMSGRGKTHVAKNFLRQIVGSEYALERRGGEKRHPCIVIIDPEDEYWGLRDDPDFQLDANDEAQLVSSGGKVGGVGKRLGVYAAVEKGSTYKGCDTHTDFTIPFDLVHDFPYLIAGGELNEAQYDGLVQLINDFFRGSTEKTYNEFRKHIDSEELEERYKNSIHPETLKAVIRRVKKSQFTNVFDQGANPITELYKDIFAEDAVSVVPTNHLSAEAERVVVLTVMSMIADAKTKALEKPWAQKIAQFPVVLAVDEAHNYLSSAETQQDRIIVEKFVTAAKQGRKNRLGLVLITQNPQDVHEAVLSQTSTRVLLGMEANMAERAGAPKQYQKALPYFEKGRIVVHSPDNSRPLEIRGLDFCVVRH